MWRQTRWPISGLLLPNQLKLVSSHEHRGCHLLIHLLAYLFVCSANRNVWTVVWGKWLTNCALFRRWMRLLSHGDVTFQQEVQNETLSEDFVPPGCVAECWVQGCWPRHRFISTSAAALRVGPCPSHSAAPLRKPSPGHATVKGGLHMTLLCIQLSLIEKEAGHCMFFPFFFLILLRYAWS